MLIASFYINYAKEFELALTGDNLKNTKNTVIQRKCKKYSNFIKNAYISKKLDRLYNLFFFLKKKLHQIFCIGAKIQPFGVLPSEIK